MEFSDVSAIVNDLTMVGILLYLYVADRKRHESDVLYYRTLVLTELRQLLALHTKPLSD